MKKAFFGLAAAALVYELVALRNRREGDTISEIIWDLSDEYPVLPFAAGVVGGHFFRQRKR